MWVQRLLDRRSQKLTSKLKPIDWGDTKSINMSVVNVLNEDNIQDDKVSLVKAMVNKLLANVGLSKKSWHVHAINGDMFTADLPDVGKIKVDINGLQWAVNKHTELFPQIASTHKKDCRNDQ